jgi:hypothetical protein
MHHYQFSNVEITDSFISANVFKDGNYIMQIGAEKLHIKHTNDIEDNLYEEFRKFILDYLKNTDFKEPLKPTKIINMWDHVRKPS